jgi:hypothetical protein
MCLSITVSIRAESAGDLLGGKADLKVYYGFIKIFPLKQKIRKNKKPKKVKPIDKPIINSNRKKTEKKANPNIDSAEAKSAGGLETVKKLVQSYGKPAIKILGKVKIRAVDIICITGSDDAAKTAINYGLYCAAFYGFTEWMKGKMGAKVKRVKVVADFGRDKDYFKMSLKLKLKVGTFIFQLIKIIV